MNISLSSMKFSKSEFFISINPEEYLLNALTIMGENAVWDLPVVDSENILVGLLHLHPAIKKVMGSS